MSCTWAGLIGLCENKRFSPVHRAHPSLILWHTLFPLQ